MWYGVFICTWKTTGGRFIGSILVQNTYRKEKGEINLSEENIWLLNESNILVWFTSNAFQNYKRIPYNTEND